MQPCPYPIGRGFFLGSCKERFRPAMAGLRAQRTPRTNSKFIQQLRDKTLKHKPYICSCAPPYRPLYFRSVVMLLSVVVTSLTFTKDIYSNASNHPICWSNQKVITRLLLHLIFC